MKTTVVSGIVITLVAIVLIGWSLYYNHSVSKGFKQIQRGDTEIRVANLMGKPSKVIHSGDNRFWSSHIVDSVKEYHYEAKLLPEIWIIGFNRKDIVIYLNHNIM